MRRRVSPDHITLEEEKRAAAWFTRFNEYFIVAKAYLDNEISVTTDHVITLTLAYMEREDKVGQVDKVATRRESMPRTTAKAVGSAPTSLKEAEAGGPENPERCGLPTLESLNDIQRSKAEKMFKTIRKGHLHVEQHLLDKLDEKGLNNVAYGILKDMGKHYGTKNIFKSLEPIPKPLLEEFVAVMFGLDRLYRWQ